MNSRKIRLWTAPILILACTLVAPAALEAQCSVVNTTTPFNLPSFMVITKTLSMAGDCMTVASNAFGCGRSPTATMATMLIASALSMAATANPYCNWVCDCGPGFTSVPISTNAMNDGLPVELMDFSIEGQEDGDPTTGGNDADDEAAAARGDD